MNHQKPTAEELQHDLDYALTRLIVVAFVLVIVGGIGFMFYTMGQSFAHWNRIGAECKRSGNVWIERQSVCVAPADTVRP